jgi:exodeoxyribonuclease-3
MDYQQADVVAVQETKVRDSEFPEAEIREAGYEVVFRGEKAYNGVAFIARHPIEEVRAGFDDGESADEPRLLQARIGPYTLVNTYVPQGREIDHEMFAYKCRWLERLRAYFDQRFSPRDHLIWLGDMNVAHDPIDVYNPADRAKHVCYHEDAREAFAACREWGFVDLLRQHHPEGGHYTFFDYRSRASLDNAQGWRIDYILTSPALAANCTACDIDLEPRRQPKSSDHTFLVATFDGT